MTNLIQTASKLLIVLDVLDEDGFPESDTTLILRKDARHLAQALLEAEEVIKMYHKIFPVDELPSTWLKKYSEGE